MTVLAINGSPRKKWNTAALLEKTLDGAAGTAQNSLPGGLQEGFALGARLVSPV